MHVNRRKLLVAAAAALLMAALVTMTVDGGRAPVATLAASRAPHPSASVAVAPSPSSVTAPAFETPSAGTRVAPIGPVSAASARDGESAVQLIVSAPAFVEKGSPHDLVVGILAPRGARWVDLTVSVDADLLELRGAVRDESSDRGGATPAFEARISAEETRIAIRAEVGDELSGNEAAGVAIVRFEGVAPGSATVTVSDIIFRDLAGAMIPVASPAATAEVVVMSGPI